jgi:hypothetical protein
MVPLLPRRCLNNRRRARPQTGGGSGGHAVEVSSGLRHRFRNLCYLMFINSKPCCCQENSKSGLFLSCDLQGRKPGQEEMVRAHYLGVVASDESDQAGSDSISSQ